MLAHIARAALPLLLVAAGLATPTAAGNPSPAFREVVLDNGLTLLLSPGNAHPVIALSGFVTTGGRTEDEYYQGSLHYIEHLVFKGGTPNLPPTMYRKEMSLLGREAGGWTWDDEINFGFETPKENFAEALSLYREALLDLKFEEEWFEDEKRVVLQEMFRGQEQPERMVDHAWSELAFTAHPYGRPVIGTEKAIRELEMHATEAYYRERFTPNHMILSIAGDFDPDRMVELVREEWSGREPGPSSFELGVMEPEIRGPRSREEFVPQATRATVLTGVVTREGPDDTAALTMLAALMNHPVWGLQQPLIDQEKWVTSAQASHYFMRDYGAFQITARLDPERGPAVRAFLQDYLVGFNPSAIPSTIFEDVRRGLLAQEARERATYADRAERLGFLASRLGTKRANRWVRMLSLVTPDEVAEAAARHISPRKLVTVTVYPEGFDPSTALPGPIATAGAEDTPQPSLQRPGLLKPPPVDPLAFEETGREDGIVRFRFSNGLRLLVSPSDASRVLAASARILGGQWVEPASQAGINRFVSELGLRATRSFDQSELGQLLGSLAMTATAHASIGSRANTSRNVDYRDSAGRHLRGTADTWREALTILKETTFFPQFDPKEMSKVREDLLTEIRTLPENNLEYIKQQFYVSAFEGHPYGRPTVGTEESISAISSDDLAAFHKAHWTADRVVVTLVGDVDPHHAAEWLASHWADVPNRRAGPLPPAETVDWAPSPETKVIPLGKDYWTVNWGRPGALWTDADQIPSRVLSRMAGNDHFYKYVYGEGVSYRSWIRFWEARGPGMWIIENDVKRERFDEILAMFEEDLVRYSEEGLPRKNFEDAVMRLINSHVLSRQDNAVLAWRLAVAEGNGGFESYTRAPENLRAVTFQQVSSLAAEVFAPSAILRMVQQ